MTDVARCYWRNGSNQETDPDRMIDLVQQLITKLDEQKLRKGLTPASQPNGNAAE
jgi:hypothetical protein